MSINKTELESSTVQEFLPEWLTMEFLETNLQTHYESKELRVINFEAKPVSTKGESYLSSMYRVQVTFEKNSEASTLNLVIKVALSDENALDVSLQRNMYDKEIEFYSIIAPKINAKLHELDDVQLLAECFGVCKVRRILILEDLAAKGYCVLPIQRGYSIAESKIILKRLATFHAICAVMQQEETNIFDKIKSGGHFSRDISAFNNIYYGNLDATIEVISAWPEFSSCTAKLRRLRSDLIERVNRNYEVNSNHFNTLNHDDLWCPNLMLKLQSENKENSIQNVIFIDFQFAFWSSPTTDIHFLLATSIHESLRPFQINELAQFYHGNLTSSLKKLNYKQHIPTWNEFEVQFQERQFTAFIISCFMLPILAYNIDNASLDDLVQNNENGMIIKRKIYQQEGVQAILRKMIPYFDQMGLFD